MVESLQIKIFPNPATDIENVSYELVDAGQVTFNLLNGTGKNIQQVSNAPQSSGKHSFTIETNNLQSGMYYLQMQLNGESILKKIIIE